MHNEKVFRVRFENQDELALLRHRLGYVLMFPFIQPEQSCFNLNFAHYDERVAAVLLLQLSAKESMHNLREPSFLKDDGTVDPFVLGVPRSWSTDASKLPPSGLFRCTYNCAPEDRCYDFRKQMMRELGGWPVQVAEK